MLTQIADELQEKKPGLFVVRTLWGRGGLYSVSLMISTAKNIKISVKIASYRGLVESGQTADLNGIFLGGWWRGSQTYVSLGNQEIEMQLQNQVCNEMPEEFCLKYLLSIDCPAQRV